jgi:transporter family-2 protein
MGQLLAAATIDHFGLLGVAQHTLTPLRLVGIAMLVGGVALVRA